jgi:small-conductance mechanosensitive channel
MLAVRFYDAVVALHVMAIVLAFGVTFAYPVMIPYITRNHPQAVPAMYDVMSVIGRRLITPAATVALLLGAYLATDADLWSEVWVTVPLVILIVLLGMAGAVFTPTERKLAEATRRDVDAAAGGAVSWSPEVDALARRNATAGAVASLLVLLAIYFMVAKPFA